MKQGLGRIPAHAKFISIKFNPRKYTNKIEMALSFTQLLTTCVDALDHVEIYQKID